MLKFHLLSIPPYYKNKGQQAERAFRYTVTGRLEKADNLPIYDLFYNGKTFQIKSPRATICRGVDLEQGIKAQDIDVWVFVDTRTYEHAYLMSEQEFIDFCNLFAEKTPTFEANGKNGGKSKTKRKLKEPSNKMFEYLEKRCLI